MNEPMDPDELRHLFTETERLAPRLDPPVWHIAERAARRRRTRRFAVMSLSVGGAAAAVAVIVAASAYVGSPARDGERPIGASPSNSQTSTSSSAGPAPSNPSGTPSGLPTPSTDNAARALPITVQSDSEMKAAGNFGPTSSVLVPDSCSASGSTVTATGHYKDDLAPEGYPRAGAVVELYVYGPAKSGSPLGVQIGLLSREESPRIGGTGTWSVTVPVDLTWWQPDRCVVASQPTHDFEGAPNDY